MEMNTAENISDSNEWFDDYAIPDEGFQIDEYDLTAAPNDFNVITINNFIESGAIKIPGFQRNYVWDITKASKLIESLILGLPVPQIFLYEEGRNSFLVIDGQQRLMSIYYFMKQRFPRKEKRAELRKIFDREGKIPDEILNDDEYFSNFKLSLPERVPNQPNLFKDKKYSTLNDYKSQFELRPIRNVIVKQNVPKDDNSSIYEIFNRLNTGGVNLTPQEIRSSLFHSDFYEMLQRINLSSIWRGIVRTQEPDLHMKDVEILLRSYAMLIDGNEYKPSLIKFLNQFSKKCKTHTPEQNKYLENLFNSFLTICEDLPEGVFINKRNKFNIALFEAFFAAVCRERLQKREILKESLNIDQIKELAEDPEFLAASQSNTTSKANVLKRLERAHAIVDPL